MTNFTIETVLDLTDKRQAMALINFVSEVSGVEAIAEETPVSEPKEDKATKPKSKATKTKAVTKTEEPEEVKEEPKEEPKEEVKEEPKEEIKQETEDHEEPSVTISEIRKEMAIKVGSNREVIKKMLTALGATSVTTLKPDNYDEFYELLKAL